jgi:hypothetical protein
MGGNLNIIIDREFHYLSDLVVILLLKQICKILDPFDSITVGNVLKENGPCMIKNQEENIVLLSQLQNRFSRTS